MHLKKTTAVMHGVLQLLGNGWFSLVTESESESEIVSGAYDLVNIKKRNKRDGIGVRRIRTFPFSSDSAYDSVAYDLVKIRSPGSEA